MLAIVSLMLGRFSARRPSTRAVRETTWLSAASTLGEAAAIRRVASSTWPTADSTTGRTASLVSLRPATVSWTDPTIWRTLGAAASTVSRTSPIMWLMLAPLDRPEPDLFQDRVEHAWSRPPGAPCPAPAARVDWPVERMLTRDWPVRLDWIAIRASCLEPDGQVGRDRQADPGPEDPVDLGQGDGDDPARLDPGDPDLAAGPDALAVAEVDVDLAAVGQEARPAPGQRRAGPAGPPGPGRPPGRRGSRVPRIEHSSGFLPLRGFAVRDGHRRARQDVAGLARRLDPDLIGDPLTPRRASGPSGRRPARRGRPGGTSRR